MRLGLHPHLQTARACSAFVEVRGLAGAVERGRQIAALPSKHWRGVRVYAMTCRGDFGRGPHELWLSEAYLWSLIDLRYLICPFHR